VYNRNLLVLNVNVNAKKQRTDNMTYGVPIPNLARELDSNSTPADNDDVWGVSDFFAPLRHELPEIGFAVRKVNGSGPLRTGCKNEG
jgi:hypothetical protein